MAADALLLSASVPLPVSPPIVTAVYGPKLKRPAPLVSSVLCSSASGLPSVSVPPATSVLPVKKVFVAVSVSVPLPAD
jgi:hypothetical protein